MLSPLQGSLISFELLYCITIKTFTINRNIGYISVFYSANLVWAWTIVQCKIVLKLWLLRYYDIQVLIYSMIYLSLNNLISDIYTDSICYIYYLWSLSSTDFLFCTNTHKKHERYSFCTLVMYTHVQYKGYNILLSEQMIILLYIWCKKRYCSYFFFETWIVHQKTCLSIESI